MERRVVDTDSMSAKGGDSDDEDMESSPGIRMTVSPIMPQASI